VGEANGTSKGYPTQNQDKHIQGNHFKNGGTAKKEKEPMTKDAIQIKVCNFTEENIEQTH
jgi:hypothetical protein